MINEFFGKTVVVTGAAKGIGRETATHFAEQGAFVYLIDVDKKNAENAVDCIREFGGQARFVHTDVSHADQCERAIREVIEERQQVDCLVNGAGITCRQDVVDTTESDWDRVLNVNLKSVFLMCKYVVPHMRERRRGWIVNIASGWGLVGGSKAVSYCASKGGVVLLTKAMALDHGKDGININCVCPGDTETDMLVEEARQLGLPANHLIDAGINRPIGRIGIPRDISEAILFLSSSRASFVTGSSLVVDGGGLAGAP